MNILDRKQIAVTLYTYTYINHSHAFVAGGTIEKLVRRKMFKHPSNGKLTLSVSLIHSTGMHSKKLEKRSIKKISNVHRKQKIQKRK